MSTNATTVNKIAKASIRLASRAANIAVMTALADAWNALTDEQRDDFTANVGDIDTVAVAITLGGTSAHLVDDEWHEGIGEDNDAALEYVSGLETLLNDIDSDAQYMGELWDGADPEGDESYRPLHYTRAQIDSARESYQKALANMAALLATN
jgi:hypothetical protein